MSMSEILIQEGRGTKKMLFPVLLGVKQLINARFVVIFNVLEGMAYAEPSSGTVSVVPMELSPFQLISWASQPCNSRLV